MAELAAQVEKDSHKAWYVGIEAAFLPPRREQVLIGVADILNIYAAGSIYMCCFCNTRKQQKPVLGKEFSYEPGMSMEGVC